MWVGSRFLGDDDKEVMWLQHDVYHRSLRIIADTCQDYTLSAQRILSDHVDEFIERFTIARYRMLTTQLRRHGVTGAYSKSARRPCQRTANGQTPPPSWIIGSIGSWKR